MAYWSIALLVMSAFFLAYRHPPAVLGSLPQWVRPAKRRSLDDDKDKEPNESPVNGLGNAQPIVQIDVMEPYEAEATPKALSTDPGKAVPDFSLNGDIDAPDSTSPPALHVPSFPAANGARRVVQMPPPPKPDFATPQKKSTNLMQPPARPTLAPPPSSASSLRVPNSGPLPNRGLPANSQQRVNGGLSLNGTAVTTPNPRGKVLLSPGHSPMDWAALTRKGNLSGVNTFQRITPSMLKSMTGRKGRPAWSSWQGSVYNITPYLPFHPGGEAEMMKAAGRDGTKLFMEVHPWVNWENMLDSCVVGVMVPEDYGNGNLGGALSLEDMD